MDPNAALAEIRKELGQVREAIEGDGDLVDSASCLVDAVEALDEWLSKGGFQPDAWRVKYGDMTPEMQEVAVARAVEIMAKEGL
jgi:hypothetical protein